MSSTTNEQNSIRQLMRLMSYMNKRIWLYGGSITGMAITFAVCLHLVTAYKFQTLFDAAASGNKELVKGTALEIVISVLIACVLCPIFSYGIFFCIQKTVAGIRLKIYKQIEDLPMSYFDKNHSGEIISCLNSDLNALEDVYFWPIFMTALSIIMGLGSAVIMFFMSWETAVFTLLIGVVTSIVNSMFARPIRKAGDSIQHYAAVVSQYLVDLLSGFYIIKMFGIGKILEERYDKKNRELAKNTVKYGRLNAALEGSNYLLNYTTYLGVIVFGAVLIANNRLSVGTAIACTQLFGGISFMFGQLGGFVSQIQRSLAGASRVFKLLDEQVETLGDVYSLPTEDMIAFKNVVFSYDDYKRVLDGVSFSLSCGQTAAFVGTSGSGKSTVLKLLLGFYPRESGYINVGGEPIDKYSLEQLRDLISYVPQDAYLFQGTIEDNIKMGNERASREEVISAAKGANAHDFIMELPEGYDTLVGERGTRLSGGQRQRIAIARAIIKNAPILLLDEATSALDSKSEELVQEALKELMKNRTTIVIAHRLSTIENADIIFVLDEGKITEQGKHRELMEKGGLYNNLYEMQFS